MKPDDETAVVSTMLCTIHLTPAPPRPGKLGGGTVNSISLGLPCTVWPSVAQCSSGSVQDEGRSQSSEQHTSSWFTWSLDTLSPLPLNTTSWHDSYIEIETHHHTMVMGRRARKVSAYLTATLFLVYVILTTNDTKYSTVIDQVRNRAEKLY